MKDNKAKVYCNVCGNGIKKIPKVDICKDHLCVQKEWGYFSNKDFTKHFFSICEKCYDTWIETFVIPVHKEVVTEWAGNLSSKEK